MRRPRLHLTPAHIFLGLAVLGLLVWIVASRLAMEASLRAGRATYDTINPGMTVPEVDKRIRLSVPCMGGQVGTAMVYHDLNGTFMIGVVYEPNPGGPPSPLLGGRRVPDDWVAKEKCFLELGRGGRVDDIFVGLGLRPQRVVDVESSLVWRRASTTAK